MSNQKTCRPLQLLRSAGHRWSTAWRMYGQALAGRGHDLPDWPDWCYCPMAAAAAVVNACGRPAVDGSVATIASLAAWRMGRTIYRYDPALYTALESTPVERIPRRIIYRLPQWCVYIETQGWLAATPGLAGFFAHLEWDAKTGRHELRLLLDLAGGILDTLVPVPVHLVSDNLDDCLRAMLRESMIQGERLQTPAQVLLDQTGMTSELAQITGRCLSLLLYLCSEQPDYDQQPPANPAPVKTRRGPRVFPAANLTTVRVGAAIGSTIRQGSASAPGHTGRTVTPHVRRAHWHTYWTGSGADRRPVLRWLHPTLVGARNLDHMPAVVRPVRGQ